MWAAYAVRQRAVGALVLAVLVPRMAVLQGQESKVSAPIVPLTKAQAIGRILNVLRSPISLMSRPSREEALELATRFEVTATDLLERAAARARDT